MSLNNDGGFVVFSVHAWLRELYCVGHSFAADFIGSEQQNGRGVILTNSTSSDKRHFYILVGRKYSKTKLTTLRVLTISHSGHFGPLKGSATKDQQQR